MTNESGHLASIAAAGVCAGFFIMLVYQAAPGQPAATSAAQAAAPAAEAGQPPYEEGSARLMTQSVLGMSSSAIDPTSYTPAPPLDPEGSAPVPGPADAPVPVAIAGVDEGVPRERLVEQDRIIERDRPLVEQQVGASARTFIERERIGRAFQREAGRPFAVERREWRQDRMVRPIARREERRVFAGGRVGPTFSQGSRRGFGGGGFGGGHR